MGETSRTSFWFMNRVETVVFVSEPQVAIKIIQRERLHSEDNFKEELKVARKLQHPNIVLLLASYQDCWTSAEQTWWVPTRERCFLLWLRFLPEIGMLIICSYLLFFYVFLYLRS
jgi:serine/threonine protein kinase